MNLSNTSNDATPTSSIIHLVDTDQATRTEISEIANLMKVNVNFYDNAEAFLQSYIPQDHGCVVSEFRLLGMNGIVMQEVMQERHLRVPIVFVTAFAETPLTVRAIKAGAITVLEKPFSRQDLWDALRTAFTIEDKFRRIDAKHSQVRNRLSQLTPKERQVLDLIVAGRPNKMIANELSVSVRTVEARRHQIFKKAGADSVAELVKIIVEAGELNGE